MRLDEGPDGAGDGGPIETAETARKPKGARPAHNFFPPFFRDPRQGVVVRTDDRSGRFRRHGGRNEGVADEVGDHIHAVVEDFIDVTVRTWAAGTTGKDVAGDGELGGERGGMTDPGAVGVSEVVVQESRVGRPEGRLTLPHSLPVVPEDLGDLVLPRDPRPVRAKYPGKGDKGLDDPPAEAVRVGGTGREEAGAI